MAEKKQDLGFGIDTKRKTKRLINPDGSFNVRKKGNHFDFRDTYLALILAPWPNFLIIIFASLIVINLFFTYLFILIGIENIIGISAETQLNQFLETLYFSFQTFTTVGYGQLAPSGNLMSIVAALESMTGLVSFAVVTGLIYGRFSRPSTRLLYSNNFLITPYKEGMSLQFRIANSRMSTLLELDANVNIQITEHINGKYHRNYYPLKLELNKITFFPLNWTIVHKIDDKSPLYNLKESEILNKDLEILILIKGFDDTFGQVVHSRYSYTEDDLVWNAKFKIPYETIENGDVIFNINQIHDFDKLT